MSKTVKTAAIAVAACMLLSACDGGTIHKTSKLGDLDVLSIDARQRLVLRGGAGPDGRPITCAEPSPDAIVAQAAVLAASGSGSGGGANAPKGSGALGGGYSEAVASIAMRTPTVQLLRDGYYRYCEALMNGVLGPEEYKLSLRLVDMFVVTIIAIENLGGTVVVPAVAVGTTAAAKIDAEGGIDVKSSGEMLKIEVAKQPDNEANAAAIRDIVLSYLRLKSDLIVAMMKMKKRNRA